MDQRCLWLLTALSTHRTPKKEEFSENCHKAPDEPNKGTGVDDRCNQIPNHTKGRISNIASAMSAASLKDSFPGVKTNRLDRRGPCKMCGKGGGADSGRSARFRRSAAPQFSSPTWSQCGGWFRFPLRRRPVKRLDSVDSLPYPSA